MIFSSPALSRDPSQGQAPFGFAGGVSSPVPVSPLPSGVQLVCYTPLLSCWEFSSFIFDYQLKVMFRRVS